MENLDIRFCVADRKLKYKEIAAEMHIHHASLSRMLSKPLTPIQRERILAAVEILQERKQGND